MTSCARVSDFLDAYHDGELSRLARRRVERHLEHCSGCRRQLAGASSLRELLCESEAAATSPDVWGRIEPRLAAIDAQLAAEPRRALGRRLGDRLRALADPLPWLLRPVAAAAAIALLVAVYMVGVGPQEGSGDGVVRWLDAHGNSVMLLEEQDATIIWLIDPVLDEVSTGKGAWRGFI